MEIDKRSRVKAALDMAASTAFIVVCAVVSWSVATGREGLGRTAEAVPSRAGQPGPQPGRPAVIPLPKDPVSLDGVATRGRQDAKVVVIEFSDFQCPFCGVFEQRSWPDLQQKYVASGKVLWAFRHLPLERLHQFAFRAAEAAECALGQGRFWEMHDKLFENQTKLDDPSLVGYAKAVGVDVSRFESCMLGSARAAIRTSLGIARVLGASGTPAFFFGTLEPDGRVKLVERISGAVPVAQFETILDRLLSMPARLGDARVSGHSATTAN